MGAEEAEEEKREGRRMRKTYRIFNLYFRKERRDRERVAALKEIEICRRYDRVTRDARYIDASLVWAEKREN